MKRTTILHLVHRLGFGGTERVIVNLLNHSGDRCRNLICSFFPCDQEFLEEVNTGKDSIICLGKREGNDVRAPFKIASLCRAEHVDIIHSLGWSTYAEGLTASRLSRDKRVFIHSFRGMTQDDLLGIPRRRLVAEKFFSRFCSAIICPSELTRRQYAELVGIDERKISVIHNGVDIQKFALAANARESLRQELHLAGDDFVIGFVGRMDPVKNLTCLIRAFSILKLRQEKHKLLLVGDGPDYGSIKSEAEALGLNDSVLLPGMRKDVAECLSLMDLYVQPSRFEGVPNSVLEAMAAGLPVICTNVGGLPEILKDGENGILVEPENEQALSNAMDNLIQHRERRMSLGRHARERVTSMFSIESMVAGYEALYERVLSS